MGLALLFARSQGYPDEMTYALVGAASQKLGLEPARFLGEFGVHWVVNTGEQGYAELMKAGGKTLSEFLTNLPDFHTRISLIFPNLKPPEFRCSDRKPGSLHLHYFSGRAGLAPFVVGLEPGTGRRSRGVFGGMDPDVARLTDGSELGLSPQQLHRVFPFHAETDEHLVARAGGWDRGCNDCFPACARDSHWPII